MKMYPRSPTDSRHERKLFFVFILAFAIYLADAFSPKGANTTCPALTLCLCWEFKHGAKVKCNARFVGNELNTDMQKLQGVYINKLSLENFNSTQLQVSWFANLTIFSVRINNCNLHDIEDAVSRAMTTLSSIWLTKNELRSVPLGLAAAKRLQRLTMQRNPIKHLQGMLTFSKLWFLDLSFNEIETIDEEYLYGLPKLRYVALWRNNIHKLPPNLFLKTRLLKKVELQVNRISSVEGVFNDLPQLEVLLLTQNNISDTDSISRSTFPCLKELALGQNRINVISKFSSRNSGIRRVILSNNAVTDIMPGAFKLLGKLTKLDLKNNSISFLNDSYFAHDSILEHIDFSMNKVTTLSNVFNRTRMIKVMKLSFNQILDISVAFIGLTKLRELYLKGNLISSIEHRTFQDNIRLIHIDLASNNIRWIAKNAFEGLLSLRRLHLDRNLLLSLNGSIRNLPQLQYLGAAFNEISSLEKWEFGSTSALTAICLQANNITNVEGAFIGVTGLLSLNLGDNQVELLRRSDFALEISGALAVTIYNNPLICDCRLAWLIKADSEIRTTRMTTCMQPWWLKGKQLRELAQEDFFRWEDGCDPGCHCRCNDESLDRREIDANCSSATIGRIPNVLPDGTIRLDLSGNELGYLDGTVKKAAPHLEVLSLNNNALSRLNVSSIPEKVHSLDLRGNKLNRLPYSLVTQLNLSSIWLSGNRYACECVDYRFRQWIQAHGNVVPDARNIMCARNSNHLVSQKKFVTLGQKDLCPPVIPRGVVYLLLVFGILAIILALSAAYLRYKQALKIWLRGRGVCGLAWGAAEDELDTDKLFDVFVSFSSKDADWIHEEIIPRLEANGFSCCTYERNFKGGFLLQDIIHDAVACSRRTLLVLTQNFLESDWCRLEFRLAHQRALLDNVNRLVIVVVDELVPGTIDEDLQLYLRAANYLRWGEPNFWDRLLHSLPTKEANRKLIIEGVPSQLTANSTGDIELE
ncbi:protein toll-like [Dermacentor albipictus]|uniref:protein toll-like n=1 Tax=Dermacentor albipictus TaxID=60249 RepID=UPI0038FC32D9